MPKEAQPLSFKEVKQGSSEDHSSYGILTQEALRQIQTLVGKQIELNSFKEDWYYEGPEEGDDHSTSDTFVTGILTNVDERNIKIAVRSGKTQHNDGSSTIHKESDMEFPFYCDGCSFQRVAGNSQIISITADGQTFVFKNNGIEKEAGEKQEMPPFEEIRQGSPEDYLVYRKLTSDIFRHIQNRLGTSVQVVLDTERWVHSGPDDEDHSTSKTHVCGTLTNVDEQTLEVSIQTGRTTYDTGTYADLIGKKMKFPFHQEQFELKKYRDIVHINTFILGDQVFQWERDVLPRTTPYINVL
ncbi:MAG: hypothetical protein NTZ07_01425 [Candidatus Woesebacteria bacterium]|nr:hypothetical protein [Candidatus Woesebacteria bacterium]